MGQCRIPVDIDKPGQSLLPGWKGQRADWAAMVVRESKENRCRWVSDREVGVEHRISRRVGGYAAKDRIKQLLDPFLSLVGIMSTVALLTRSAASVSKFCRYKKNASSSFNISSNASYLIVFIAGLGVRLQCLAVTSGDSRFRLFHRELLQSFERPRSGIVNPLVAVQPAISWMLAYWWNQLTCVSSESPGLPRHDRKSCEPRSRPPRR